MCCSMLQSVARDPLCCVLESLHTARRRCVAVNCSMFCCSVLRCVGRTHCAVFRGHRKRQDRGMLQCVAVCCVVLQCVAVC